MPDVQPYTREAGSGPGVVCLHSNASTSAQWRALINLFSTSHRVLAPDLYGSGKSVDWPSQSEIALLDEVKFIEPVLASAGMPLMLVGHSYGAAVALLAALYSGEAAPSIYRTGMSNSAKACAGVGSANNA